MNAWKADLHIHTVLSPCGDLDMSPARIIEQAKARQLDIIGITDHNSTRQCRLIRDMAKKQNLTVLMGAEVSTQEEVHALAFFETTDQLNLFQQFLDAHLPDIPNEPEKMGYQVVVNEHEHIVYEEPRWLAAGLTAGIDEVAKEVHRLRGLFIPAHINRAANSIYSQLGFFPKGLPADALEISAHISEKTMRSQHPELSDYVFIQSSDAHYPNDIGHVFTTFQTATPDFAAIANALKNRCTKQVTVSRL